jgi:hypothetical protein
MVIIINHKANHLNWNQMNEQVNNPKTLVLGSFNPYREGDNLDYYYGRSANYFWNIVEMEANANNGSIDNNPELKLGIMDNRFVCLDVIN